jgi:hypothetical protein
MKILAACEESQRVTIEFRAKGHEAYSCDIIDCSGGHPEWHIKEDVLPLLNGNCKFKTCDGKEHEIEGKWDRIIAFPPCTHLAVSGAKHFEKKRADGRQRDGLEFFCKFFEADCDHIAIENPVNIVSGEYAQKWFPDIAERYNLPKKPTQRIHPYLFGDPFEKLTCLWLKGLPMLEETNVVTPPPRQVVASGKTLPLWYSNCGGNRPKNRSKTFHGIAKAMATQWG